jgi:hypothetical protein
MRVFQDDLPSVGVSRLRANGTITAEMTRAMIGLADVEVEVGLSLQRCRSVSFASPCSEMSLSTLYRPRRFEAAAQPIGRSTK